MHPTPIAHLPPPVSPPKKWRRAGSSDRRNAWLTDGRARWTGGCSRAWSTRRVARCARRGDAGTSSIRGGHELHAGRAGGGRVQTHRQGVAQRKDTIERQERETVGGLVSFHRGHSQKISSRYLSQDERISIADWRKAGMSVRGIARTLNRPASTASRELVRNTNPATGMYEPYRPQQMSADGPDDPSPRRSIRCPACSHTFAQDCGRIGVPSRSRGACAPISRIMMLCMCARRRSTRPSTSRPKAN